MPPHRRGRQVRPPDRLAISTQCGFASTIEGNDLTTAAQWAKLDLMLTVAEKIWG